MPEYRGILAEYVIELEIKLMSGTAIYHPSKILSCLQVPLLTSQVAYRSLAIAEMLSATRGIKLAGW